MGTQTVKLTFGTDTSDREILTHAIDVVKMSMARDSWANRPVYDEDAGVYVNRAKYDPLESAAMFALMATAENLYQRLQLTDDEYNPYIQRADAAWDEWHARSDGASTRMPEIEGEIEREFTETEIACLVQCAFHYLRNIETIYARREWDLYDSDNHYTGKSFSEFLAKANERSTADKKKILAFLRRFGR